MATSKKHQPIVWDIETTTFGDYHLVNRRELSKVDNETLMKKRIDELNMRAEFARKHYKSRYDRGHRKWMQNLAAPMKSSHKVHLSLDALMAIDK